MSPHSADTDGLQASKRESLIIPAENAKLASTGDCRGNVCSKSRPAYKRGLMKVRSLCSCRHFAFQREVRQVWRRLLGVRLLFPVALPGGNNGVELQTQESCKSLAGKGFKVVSALGLEPRTL